LLLFLSLVFLMHRFVFVSAVFLFLLWDGGGCGGYRLAGICGENL